MLATRVRQSRRPHQPHLDVAATASRLAVVCHGVTKEFGTGDTRVQALAGVDLSVESGAMTLLVGPSGCGKTTLISIVAGLLDPTAGEIIVLGRDLHRLSRRRLVDFRGQNIGFVFQQYNLLPALTAAENAAIPLLVAGWSRTKAVRKATEILEQVGLAGRVNAFPSQLSGGQQQRVAIARRVGPRPQAAGLRRADRRARRQIGSNGYGVVPSCRRSAGPRRDRGNARQPHFQLCRPHHSHERRTHRARRFTMRLSMTRKLYVYVPSVLAAVLFVAATVHVLNAQKPVPKRDPLISPAATSFGSTVAATGIVEAQTENIAVGSALSGVVLEVYVPASKVGQHVASGDPLFRVDDRHLRSELVQSEARIAAAEAQLHKLESMPRPEELPASEARVRAASAAADRMKDDLVRAKQLYQTRVVTEQEYITRRLSYEAAVQQLKEAEAQDRLLKSGAWEPDKAIARTTISQAKTDAERIRTEIERATVRAPVDGEILQVNIRVGEQVASQSEKPLMVLGSVRELHVRVDVDEDDIPRFQTGGNALAHVRGNAGQKLPLRFARVEPLVVAKRTLSGGNTERIDTRVLQIIYTVEDPTRAAVRGSVARRVYRKRFAATFPGSQAGVQSKVTSCRDDEPQR